jgi:hypothetical protein
VRGSRRASAPRRVDVDDVPGADLLDIAASPSDQADAVGDVERLALGVAVPGGAGAAGEPDVGAADGRLLVGVADAVDADGPGEPVLGSGTGLAAALGELPFFPVCSVMV